MHRPATAQGRVKDRMSGLTCGDGQQWPREAPEPDLWLPACKGQHRSSAQVGVTWRLDAPDSTAMLTPRRSSSLAASTQLGCLHDDFDGALHLRGRDRVLPEPGHL